MYKNIIIGLSIISLVNCNAQKETTKQTATQQATIVKETPLKKDGNIIYFSEGENKFLPEFQMNVTFKGIAEDSRCPEGTQCVWAGVAVANIEFMSTTSRPMILQFSTAEVKGKDYHKTQSFNGYTISLKELAPYPSAQEGTKSLSGKYKIAIEITKDDSQNQSTMK
ncbi:hypothetical protein [Chryseobacterium balustinum]|uniref:Lipoprotein n=1 Tax=Chryseobacterium balustinum TaxID=246 RepID=A0AAX2IJL5_9FLAO|nr:hypothetical protein [Chryseobacterium balustinum]AZB30432.1 hypothetical protein EB354_14845 [Chryseobacterium balustinum]SKB47525.1 hypothetical protein SAMN05421800_102104 [Chryseobacterium balustinum]SQA89165.1 Uncharacterised protein [Chryseobacterium balustinum]